MKRQTIYYIILAIGLVCTHSNLKAQTVKRQAGETTEAFVQRLAPATMELAHPVIETTTWDSTAKAIVAFYGYDDTADVNTGYNKIYGHLYLPAGNSNYRDISFGPIEEDGGYPEIISVFFANADKDAARELVVICQYMQRHYDYSGDAYETFIFDNPSGQSKLTEFNKLEEHFRGCDCEWRNGKTETAKFKTAKEIRAELKKLGY